MLEGIGDWKEVKRCLGKPVIEIVACSLKAGAVYSTEMTIARQ
jgi:hypothetical protein